MRIWARNHMTPKIRGTSQEQKNNPKVKLRVKNKRIQKYKQTTDPKYKQTTNPKVKRRIQINNKLLICPLRSALRWSTILARCVTSRPLLRHPRRLPSLINRRDPLLGRPRQNHNTSCLEHYLEQIKTQYPIPNL